MSTVRYFGSRKYDWSGLSEQKTVIGKARRSVLQFSPHSWDDFDWRLTSSPLRCVQCLFPIVLILLMEVSQPDCLPTSHRHAMQESAFPHWFTCLVSLRMLLFLPASERCRFCYHRHSEVTHLKCCVSCLHSKPRHDAVIRKCALAPRTSLTSHSPLRR